MLPGPNARGLLDSWDSSRQVKLAVVLTLFQCTRSTLYRWINLGKFPKPTRCGRKSVWSVATLRQVLDSWDSGSATFLIELTRAEQKALEKLGGGSVQLAINRITNKLLTKE